MRLILEAKCGDDPSLQMQYFNPPYHYPHLFITAEGLELI